MFDWKSTSYKVVVLVPGGRRAHLSALMPHLIHNPIVDKVRILLNTEVALDLAYMRHLSEHTKVELLPLPKGQTPNGNRTVNLIYKDAIDNDTVYLKIDDDVNWMEDGTIEAVIRGKLKSEISFLASPIVINNHICSHILQRHRKIDFIKRYVRIEPRDFTWERAVAAKNLHWHLQKLISNDSVESLHVPDQLVATTRMSINFICFLGADMKAFSGEIPEYWPGGHQSDEEFLTVHAPAILGRANIVIGNAVAAHHSFFPQTHDINRTLILEKYQTLAKQKYNAVIPRPKLPAPTPSVLPDLPEATAVDRPLLMVSSPAQGAGFLCHMMGKSRNFTYSGELFAADAAAMPPESTDAPRVAQGQLFERTSQSAYARRLKTQNNAANYISKATLSPADMALHAKHFHLVAFFRHRTVAVPTADLEASKAVWDNFQTVDHALPALQAVKRKFHGVSLDKLQMETLAHLVYWYRVCKAFETDVNGGQQKFVPILQYWDVMTLQEKELTTLLKRAIPVLGTSAKTVAKYVVGTRFEGQDPEAKLDAKRRIYRGFAVESWYQKTFQDLILRNDPDFESSPYMPLLK